MYSQYLECLGRDDFWATVLNAMREQNIGFDVVPYAEIMGSGFDLLDYLEPKVFEYTYDAEHSRFVLHNLVEVLQEAGKAFIAENHVEIIDCDKETFENLDAYVSYIDVYDIKEMSKGMTGWVIPDTLKLGGNFEVESGVVYTRYLHYKSGVLVVSNGAVVWKRKNFYLWLTLIPEYSENGELLGYYQGYYDADLGKYYRCHTTLVK